MSRLLAACALAIAVASSLGAVASGSEGIDKAALPRGRPLVTAVVDPSYIGPESLAAFAHTRSSGASVVRLGVRWAEIAPAGAHQPDGFDPVDPADPYYRWGAYDVEIRRAVASGLEPMVDVIGAPVWAQDGKRLRQTDGPVRPSPSMLADFATAIAKRYSGRFGQLPRVRYWQIWNKPNLSIELRPKRKTARSSRRPGTAPW